MIKVPSTQCYPPHIFINEADIEDCLCLICFKAIRHPVVDLCNHIFSQNCIAEWMRNKKMCPLSRNAISMSSFSDAQNILPGYFTTRMRCMHYPDCSWEGVMSQIEAHLNDECQFGSTLCSFKNCDEEFLLDSEFKEHVKICPKRRVMCRYCRKKQSMDLFLDHIQSCESFASLCLKGCGQRITPSETQYHNKIECFLAEVPCPFSFLGCQSRTIRQDLYSHFQEAEFKRNHLLMMITSFVEMLDQRNNFLCIIADGYSKLHKMSSAFKIRFSKAKIQKDEDPSILSAKSRALVKHSSKHIQCPIAMKGKASESSIMNKTICERMGKRELLNSETMNDLVSKLNYQKYSYNVLRKLEMNFSTVIEDAGSKVKNDEDVNSSELKNLSAHYLEIKNDLAIKYQLDSNIEAVTEDYLKVAGGGNIILLNSKVVPFEEYNFQVFMSWYSKMALGVCQRSKLIASKFKLPKRKDHGCYLVFPDGKLLKNGSEETYFEPNRPQGIFKRYQKTLLKLVFDSVRMILTVHNSNGPKSEIKINDDDDLRDLYVCVLLEEDLNIYLDDVESNQRLGFVQFSPFDKGDTIILKEKLTIEKVRYQSGEIEFKKFKHQVKHQIRIVKQSSEFFEFSVENNDWRWYGNDLRIFPGFILTKGEPNLSSDKSKGQPYFETGDIIEFHFYYEEYMFTFTNLTKSATTVIVLGESFFATGVCLKITMPDENESIEIVK
jgi:hypothetical protein